MSPVVPPRLTLITAAAAVAAGSLAFGATVAQAKPPKLDVKVKHGTLDVRGSGKDDTIVLRLLATKPGVLGIDANGNGSIDFAAKRSTFDRIHVAGRGGDDTITIDESNGVFTDTERTTLDGGRDNDTIQGGSGDERLYGGRGDDRIDGGRGADQADLGSGDDTFRWDPGEGSDTVEGRGGNDVLDFNGSAGAEAFAASPNGNRVRFTRDVGNIVMDLRSVEQIDTDLSGGAAPDGQNDRVSVVGTDGPDTIVASGGAGSETITGGPALINLTNVDPTDALTVDARGGDDTVQGGQLADLLLGGAGNDAVDGGLGNDTALLGAGDDTFTWDPGEGSDTVEGQEGADTMRFNGSNAGEAFDVSANGGRVRFTRNVGNIVMDVNDIEAIDTAALGGADTLVQHDLSGTDVRDVRVDLAGTLGGTAGDAAADSVSAEGTGGDDVIAVAGDANGVNVLGLASQLTVTHSEAANDGLNVDALAGDDVVEASGLVAGVLRYSANGRAGDDVLIGSAGDDTLLGEAGDDVLLGGPGTDVLDGGAGNNTVVQ